jgi:hypothetical protein
MPLGSTTATLSQHQKLTERVATSCKALDAGNDELLEEAAILDDARGDEEGWFVLEPVWASLVGLRTPKTLATASKIGSASVLTGPDKTH